MTYRIVRFKFQSEKEILQEGVSLEEAQEHCNSPESHGEGWFDGYEREE